MSKDKLEDRVLLVEQALLEMKELLPDEGEISHLRKTDHALNEAYKAVNSKLSLFESEIDALKMSVNSIQIQIAQMQMSYQNALSALGTGSTVHHGDNG